MSIHYQGHGVTLHHGDCLDVLRTLPDASVDSVVTDPPCGICHGEVKPSDVHLDHIHPFSKGGRTNAENLRVTHSRCNIRKGAKV